MTEPRETTASGAPVPPRALLVAGLIVTATLPFAGALAAWLWIRQGDPPAREDGPGGTRPAPDRLRAQALAVDLAAAFGLMLLPVLGWILAAAFLLFRDALGDGRGLGRRLAGIRVVRAGSGRPLRGEYWASFRRNATLGLPGVQLLLVPVEALLALLGARRIGERLAPETLVVLDPPV